LDDNTYLLGSNLSTS